MSREWDAALRRANSEERVKGRKIHGRNHDHVPRELQVNYRPFAWPFDSMQAHTDREWADLLGFHSRQIYRFQAYGLNYWQADRIATALNLHPALIWPQWWDVTDTIVELEQAS